MIDETKTVADAAMNFSTHWMWASLKDNPNSFFGTGVNSFYNSDTIKGYIDNGKPYGHWTLRQISNGDIIEETVFII